MMRVMEPPKFFTWIEEHYAQPSDVPERIRLEMKLLWLHGGATDEELARIFNVPIDWVEGFVRDWPRPTRPN